MTTKGNAIDWQHTSHLSPASTHIRSGCTQILSISPAAWVDLERELRTDGILYYVEDDRIYIERFDTVYQIEETQTFYRRQETR